MLFDDDQGLQIGRLSLDLSVMDRFLSWLRMWMSPNLLTVLALSLWTHSRWTMVAHHTIHGGAHDRS